MPTSLMLVRHAESTNRDLRSQVWREVEHRYSDFEAEYLRRRDPDPGLSERGRVQAKELARHLSADIHLHAAEALLVISPVMRALETALPLIRRAQLPDEQVACHLELFEVGSGFAYRERRASELAATIETDFGIACVEVPDDDAYPEREASERDDEASARVARSWAWVTDQLADERYSLVIVVTHEELISRWLGQLFGPPSGRGVRFKHNHAGITWVSWDKNEAVIEYVNTCDHVIEGLRPDRETKYRMLMSMLDELEG